MKFHVSIWEGHSLSIISLLIAEPVSFMRVWTEHTANKCEVYLLQIIKHIEIKEINHVGNLKGEGSIAFLQ